MFAGLPVHLGVSGCQLRVDEAGDSVHQERPDQPQPCAHQPGPALHGQHRQSRDGRRSGPGDPQAAGVWVSDPLSMLSGLN